MKRWMMIFGVSAAAMFSAILGAAGCGSGGDGDSCSAEVPGSCPSSAPSYKTDIRPIFQSRCTSCHTSAGSQPDPLLDTHAGVSKDKDRVKTELTECAMPPSGSTPITAEEAN